MPPRSHTCRPASFLRGKPHLRGALGGNCSPAVESNHHLRPHLQKTGELGMRYGLIITAAVLLATTAFTPASAQTNPNDLIKLGVEAQGGADAMRAIKMLVSK